MVDVQALKTRLPQLFDLSNSEHTGVAVMLYPDAESAAAIAERDGVTVAAEALHLTLYYAGDGLALDDSTIAGLILATEWTAGCATPFTALLGGVGRFSASESSGQRDVIYASVDSPEIETLRDCNADAVQYHGIENPNPTHGFTPHITLAYVDPGSANPLLSNWEPLTVTFAALTLRVGDNGVNFPLTGANIEEDEDMDEKRTLLQRVADLFRGFAENVEQEAEEIKRTAPKFRDTSLGMVWEGVWDQFYRLNGEIDSAGGDSYHYLQDLYVASEGGMFAISVQGGKLYRTPVAVQDSGITIGIPVQVVAKFESTNRTTVIGRTADNRPIFASVLASAVLNKDQEIDSRALFDMFVERFKGDGSEYMNLYHLGKEKSRYGELRSICREGYLLLGIWVPDDTPVGRAVAQTIMDDTEGEWGVSIEFMPDDAGKLLDLDGIEVRIFDTGTLWGASVVRSVHACSWFTGHQLMMKERLMSDTIRAAVLAAVGGDESILESDQFKDLVRMAGEKNRGIEESGAIARSDVEEDDGNDGDSAAEDATAEGGDLAGILAAITDLTAKVDALQARTTPDEFELTPEAAQGLADALFAGDAFTALSRQVEQLSASLEDQGKQIVGRVEGFQERVNDIVARLERLEADESDRMRANDELRPGKKPVTVSWRAPRQPAAESGDKKGRVSLGQLAERTLRELGEE